MPETAKTLEKGNKIMNKTESETLREIMDSLKHGYSYGYDFVWDHYNNKPMPYPFFNAVLYRTARGSIGWTHYGSSANPCTLRDLRWIIEIIFQTTPTHFLEKFIRNDNSKLA